MMIGLIFAFICIGHGHTYANILIPVPNSLNINITSLKQCDAKTYPLQVANVTVELEKKKLIFSGTLSTSIDLSSPIKAELELKKKELGVWIKVPCVDNIGSCTYDDLCALGVPVNSTCPKKFTDSNVPCRCPIPKGTYTIQPSAELPVDTYNYFAVYTGKFWAKVSLSQENINLLACYYVYFDVEVLSSDTINNDEIIPFVELI